MRQLVLLSPLLVLWLSQIKVLAACNDCSSVNVTAGNTEIHIQKPHNFTIINVTFANGTVVNGPLNDSISGLEPGVQYIVYLQNITEICCKIITTVPTRVFGVLFTNINATTINVTWNNADQNAHNYSYIIIIIDGNGHNRTENTTNITTVISNLEPGTLYTFTIYPEVGGTSGDAYTDSTFTMPNAVSGFHIENINSTAVNLRWNNTDTNSANYTYEIVFGKYGTEMSVLTNDTRTTIGNLEPGTMYTFTIFPKANETKGDSTTASIYTKPNAVSGFHIENINSTAVNLRWNNTDTNSANYTYEIVFGKYGTGMSVLTNDTRTTIGDLEPGTMYTFTIFPKADATKGDSTTASIYTKPSAVSNIIVKNISTDGITLSWSIEDEAASGYTYRIYIENENLPGENFTYHSPTKTVFIQKLKPGTSYHFSIFAQVDSGRTEGDSTSVSNCTDAATVKALNCAPVLKQPELNLSWIPPNGNYNNFSIEISGGTLNKTAYYSSKDQVAIIKDLSYFVSYNVKIVTHSCGEMSFPQEKKCLTSITDPPVPLESPAVKATGHNSLKVQFSPFDSTHGPLKAYAVIITSKEMKCNNESLTGTYEDFTNKKSDSYIACVKDVQHSSNVTHYDIEIGDGSTSHGYRNGKLVPLGSYRACVAGFTHITFKADAISSRESYVSFSDFSGSVVLPQNPDVITGAVSGCILAAVLVAAIAFFIFWKKRRKDGKNNDVPFSPIAAKKSKLIKVENFESYFKKQKADSNCGFAEEYEDLRPVGVNQPKFAAELPENKGKNRYNNVLPYDISRVKLSGQYHPTSDYINANYVPGYNSRKEFIAAQGCLPNTVQDFWRMIWEKNIHTIVMLTKCIEQGRTKCEEYWPNKQSKNYGDITVAMTSEIILPEWTVRDFSMEKSDASVSQPVRQFHFTAWPDHGVPETTDLLISFRHLVQNYMKQNPPTPTLVHCSAGVGRTGTFIAIDRLIHQMEMENTVDVYGVVYDLRMHRPLMVQTEDQYVFLNQCVMDIIKSRKERKADLIYQNANAMAIYENFRPSPHLGKANGYHM